MKTKVKPAEAPSTKDKPDELVRLQLQQILRSRTFRQVDRLQRFLAFIVEETLTGRGNSLKEYAIGIDVFGREASFDPRMDPIVRVQARRLRLRLSNYYSEEGQRDEVVISIPKGGYIPTFRHSEAPARKPAALAALVSRNSVVVVPFADHSAAGNLEYFCAGLRNEIMDALSKDDSILVVGLDAAGGTGTEDAGPGSAFVITGAVRSSRDVLRITVQVIDGPRGSLIWSQSIDRELGDAFAVQEEVAQLTFQTMRDEIVTGASRRSGRRQTQNLAAQNLYLQGRYHLSQRTEQGLRRAVDFFTRAASEDPKLAEAYAGLADADNLLAHYGVLAPADVWTKAAANAAHAVLVNGESAEARTSLAHVKATQDWDWTGSEREFLLAIRLDPMYPAARHWYAVSCLTPLGRLEEAHEQLLAALAIDPVSSIISRDIALNYYYRRDLDSALDQSDHTIEQNPYFSPAYWTLGLVQEQRGDLDEAVAAFQRAIELSPPSLRVLGALGRALARAGKRAEATRILHDLEELSIKRYISPFELALICFALDRTDEGFEKLSKAYQDRCYELVTINVDPRFESVATDERFAALIRQVGLP